MSADEKLDPQVEQWFALLQQPGVKPLVRDMAISHLARVIMEDRIHGGRRDVEIDLLKAELAQQAVEVLELRLWKTNAQLFENSLKSLMLEREAPAEVQTSANGTPFRLTVVRPEGT